jgi:hypothetical protein
MGRPDGLAIMPRGRRAPGPPVDRTRGLRAIEWLRVRWRLQRPGPYLVEARAAVHRSIVPRRERHDGLSPTGAADRCVELARSFVVPRSLGRSATRRTALRIVDQTLAGVEGLFAGREGELLRTVTTGQRTVLVHASQTSSLGRGDPKPPGLQCRTRVGRARGLRARARFVRAVPGVIAEKIRVPSRGFWWVPCRLGGLGTSLVASCGVFE